MFHRLLPFFILVALCGASSAQSNPVTGWSDVFYRPIFDDSIEAIMPWLDGFLVGGLFETAGPIAAVGVAYHDGSQWHAMGDGLGPGRVEGFAEIEGHLYAYGNFGQSGSTPMDGLARWDGAAWQPVGTGLTGSIQAVAGFDGHLYCAAEGVFRLDGITWTRVIETNAWVHRLMEFDGQLLAGGDFTMANGTETVFMLGWDGYVVHPAYQGLDSRPDGLVVHDGLLHAVGWISAMGEPARGWVQAWTADQWSPLGTEPMENHATNRIASTGGDLFVLGMRWLGGPTEHFVLRWTGLEWEDFIIDEDASYFRDLEIQDGKFWLGGRFDDLGVAGATNLAWSDGQDWHPPFTGGLGCDAEVLSLAVHGDRLLVGGAFSMAGEVASPIIADWIGSAWEPMTDWLDLDGNPTSPTIESRVRVVAARGDHLLASGNWSSISGFHGERHGDGEPWTMTSSVELRSMLIWGDHLYASTNEQSEPDRIVRRPLTGGEWETLGVTGGLGGVETLAVWNEQLVAGGYFLSLDGEAIDGLAIYDGETWAELGGGTTGSVYDLTVWRGDLVVGGNFHEIGGHSMENLAVFDGQAWHSLGDIQGGHAHALGHYGSSLVVGGCYHGIGGMTAWRIALWDGDHWSTLDSGIDGTVMCLAEFQGSLYVGGYILTAGGKPSANFACWTDPTVAGLEAEQVQLPSVNRLDPATPNPFNPVTNLGFRLDKAGPVDLSIMDVRGRHLRTLITTTLPAGRHQARWDGRDDAGRAMPSGVYLVQLQAGLVESVRKITLTR